MGRFIEELIVENETYQTSDSVLEGWTKHFEDLAKKSNYQNFDQNYLKAVEDETEIILKICKDNYSHEKVSIQELKNAVKKLNTNKAMDYYGITAENFIYASETLLEYLQLLINTSFTVLNGCGSERSFLEWRIAERQLQIKTYSSNSWFIDLKKICGKYDIIEIEQYLDKPLTKIEWKRFITKKIHKYWEGAIKTKMKGYSTLGYLKCEYDIGRIYPLLKTSSANISEIKKLSISTKLATGTYILKSNKAEYSNYATNPMCRLCNKADETIEHFILLCETKSQIGTSLIVKILHEGVYITTIVTTKVNDQVGSWGTADVMDYTIDVNKYNLDLSGITSLVFELKRCGRAHVLLSSSDVRNSAKPLYEFDIGNKDYSTYIIYRSDDSLDPESRNYVNFLTPNIYDCTVYLPFWISWAEGEIKLGLELSLVKTCWDI
ncbi:unnamed protein product [Mytilus edulis]|uniref:Uncharacterized protein n=1 Tax=Mytilus edulis TaxID=6550 RepID=A0A8S3QWV6_MYTED|nr:unnamed protein product [Mytilus edulis]